MRILVVSDTHGELAGLAAVLTRLGKAADLLVHCGDGAGDAERLRELGLPCPPAISVRGNADLDHRSPATRAFEADGLPALVVHGHRWLDGSGSLLQLALAGSERGAGIVLFGHTHRPALVEAGGVRLINPGSLSKPRGAHGPSFALLRVAPADERSGAVVDVKFYELRGARFLAFDPRND